MSISPIAQHKNIESYFSRMIYKVEWKDKKILAMIFLMCYSKNIKKSWNRNENNIDFR